MSSSRKPYSNPNPYILVVDDDPNIARMAQMILQSSNYRVEVAHRADDALEQMEEELPDMVLLDIVLPGMDGFELLVQMQKRHMLPPSCVIMMSGLIGREDVKRACDTGICSYLPKPFARDALLTVVQDYFVMKALKYPQE